MSTKKFPVPLSYFSMPLGLFALGLSWRYGANIGLLPNWAAETLLAAAFVLWLMLVIAYIIKIRFFRPEFLQDLQDLVQCCFISAIPITTMLAGLAALPYQTLPAKGLILLGTAGQLAFAMYRAGGLWRGVHTLDATTPIVYLPTVATNFVSATAMAALGLSDYAWLFLGAGLFSWLSLEAAILSRLRTGTPVNAPVARYCRHSACARFCRLRCLFCRIRRAHRCLRAAFNRLRLPAIPVAATPSALDAGKRIQPQLLGFLVRFGCNDGLRFPSDRRTAFTVFRLFPRHHRLRLGDVTVAGDFEFGETGTVVGEMKNRAA